MKASLAIFLCLQLAGQVAHAQFPFRDSVAVNSYVSEIDSNKSFVQVITEGIITKTRTHQRLGGFGIYTYVNQNRDSVYKIFYHDNESHNTYRVFYFRHNQLVFATQYLEDWGQGVVLFKEGYYFLGKQTIHVVYYKDEVFRKYIAILQRFNIKEEGKRLLSNYFKNNGRETRWR